MSLTRRSLCSGVLTAPVLFAAGCAGGGAKPTPTRIELQADANVNPNDAGDPAPIVVRIYELTELTAFRNGTFFEFADDAGALLGGSLIGSAEYEITPGESLEYSRDVSSEARYVGVVAAFRDIQSAQWRDSIELEQEKSNQFIIYLTTLAVRIQELRRRRFGVF